MKYTINQTIQELKNYFKTEAVIYQAKVGYFVHLRVNGVVMKEVNALMEKLGLTVSMIRATPNQLNKISLFMEIA